MKKETACQTQYSPRWGNCVLVVVAQQTSSMPCRSRKTYFPLRIFVKVQSRQHEGVNWAGNSLGRPWESRDRGFFCSDGQTAHFLFRQLRWNKPAWIEVEAVDKNPTSLFWMGAAWVSQHVKGTWAVQSWRRVWYKEDQTGEAYFYNKTHTHGQLLIRMGLLCAC